MAAIAWAPVSWRARAACRDQTALMYAEGDDAERAALAVCARCSVPTECLAQALAERQGFGVWGGMTAKQRSELLRATRPGRGPQLHLAMVNPGCWTIVARYTNVKTATQKASRLRNGHAPLPPGAWDFNARRGDDRGELWARFVPHLGGDGVAVKAIAVDPGEPPEQQ